MTRISIRPSDDTWIVRAEGAILAESRRALELKVGSRPPVVFIPREDVAMELFERSPTASASPGLGEANHYSFVGRDLVLQDAAWSYEAPHDHAAEIAGHLAFHPSKLKVQRA